MKKTVLIFGILFYSLIAMGQEERSSNHTIRIGINAKFYNDYYSNLSFHGPSFYTEYSYMINDYFGIAPRVSYEYYRKKELIGFGFEMLSYYSSNTFSSSLKIHPFAKSFDRVSIDLGLLYQHSIITSIYKGSQDVSTDGFVNPSWTYINDFWGILSSASFDIIDLQKINLGLRVDLLSQFKKGDLFIETWQLGTYIGVKF